MHTFKAGKSSYLCKLLLRQKKRPIREATTLPEFAVIMAALWRDEGVTMPGVFLSLYFKHCVSIC